MSSPASLVTRAVDAFYWRRLEGVVSRQLFRYAFCGGMNLALDAVWYFVIYHFLIGEGRMIDLGFVYMSAPIASLFLVFPITFFTGFWLNRNVAFRASPLGTRTQLLRYALSVAGAILLNYLCMKLFVEVVGIWPTPAKLATSLPFGRIQFSCSTVFHLSRGDRGLSFEKIIHYGMLRKSCLRSSIVIMRISILRRN